jgi:hypothetical protein
MKSDIAMQGLEWLGITATAHLPSVEEVAAWLPSAAGQVRRILLLSDIHANWHALLSVLQHAKTQDYDTTWFMVYRWIRTSTDGMYPAAQNVLL